MALMTSMREKMHVVLWILLALFLLSMTIGGLVGGANIIDQLFGNINPQTTIASINGEMISPERFNNLVTQQLSNLRNTGQSINDFQIKRARDQAWESLLQDVLVSQEVQRMEISASDDEVIYHLENNPPPFLQQNPSFQTDGAFDWDKYRQALANPESNEWTPIEAFMKNTFIPNFKLQKILDESIIITQNDILDEFIRRNLEFTVTGINISSQTANADKPTDEEITSEYERTRDDFSHDELRSIKFVSWKKEPSSFDSSEAKLLIDDILKRAQKGENFPELANKYSMDPGNQSIKGGDLGWFKKGRMVKPFDDAAFNASKNQIVGPVLSNFGYHVIHVRDSKVNEAGEKEILASHILIKIEISPTTLSNIKRDATLFNYDAQDDGFEQAVSDHALNVGQHEKLDEGAISISGVGALRSAVRYAFNNDLHSVSGILENDNYYAVCSLDSIIPPGFKSLDEVRPRIENKLSQEKSKSAALEEANNLLIQVSSDDLSLETLMKIKKELKGFIKEKKRLNQGFSGVGRSNFVNGALLSASPGQILGPLETNQGYALLEIVSISEIDSTELEVQRDQIRQNIFSRKQNQYFQAWIENLKDNSDIIDNRKYYF